VAIDGAVRSSVWTAVSACPISSLRMHSAPSNLQSRHALAESPVRGNATPSDPFFSLRFLTIPYDSLRFLTFPYDSLRFLPIPYVSLRFPPHRCTGALHRWGCTAAPLLHCRTIAAAPVLPPHRCTGALHRSCCTAARFLTIPYDSLQFLTFPYDSLRFLTIPYVSYRFLTFPYDSLRFCTIAAAPSVYGSSTPMGY
jgi:hypothetical protein